MEMRQIKYFLTVARCLNFTAAAAELKISTATLSRQIRAMETELNLLLFFRDNHNVRLTESGRYMSREFEELFRNYESIVDIGKKIFEGYSGQLNFGILEEISLDGKIQDNLYRFQRNHPEAIIDLKRHSFKGLADGLLNQSLDFAVTLLFDVSNLISLRYKKLCYSANGILISTRNPLAKQRVFLPDIFKSQTFIVISDYDSHLAAEQVIKLCQSYDFYPKLRFAPDLSTAILWAEAGMGLTFAHQQALSVRNPSLRFIPFDKTLQSPDDMVVLVWNPHNGNPSINSFLKEFI